MFDVLVRGGTIIDGSGNVGYKCDVAIEGDKIHLLNGDTSSIKARSRVDASELIVAPGFIDVHTHSGLMSLAEPENEPKLRQGVTTEVVGLDGLGYAPLSHENLELMLVRNSGLDGYPPLDYDWSTVAQYLKRFNHSTSANTAYLLPNSCIRVETVGWENRPATTSELAKMRGMVRQAMNEGALGLSTGLQYPPGSFADTAELVELCKVVAECGGVYVTHVRYDLGDRVFDGFREAFKIGLLSGCPVHISHFFATIPLRGQTGRMLAFVDGARSKGVDMTFDAYPWEAGSTMLDIACPQEDYSGGPDALLSLLQDKQHRERTRGQSSQMLGNIDGMVVSSVSTEGNKWCEGLTVDAIAQKLNKDPWDTICDLLVEERLGVAFYTFGGDMNDVKVIITHPAHMFCSDALRIGDMPNPRTYATYPKVLGQIVRDERIMSLEQAIRKMTSFPAQRFGLRDRGLIREGMKADLVVFDPVTVSGVATYAKPRQFPLGIEYVFVNGQLVIAQGRHTGALPGVPVPRGA